MKFIKHGKFILLTILLITYGVISTADSGKFVIARVKYTGGGDWYANRTAIPNWLKELRKRTDIETEDDQVIIQLTDKDLYQYPFIFMTGHGNIRFTDKEVEALRFYLTHGGFLYADDTYGMDVSFRREMKRVFPDQPLQGVPNAHPIYHAFYDFPKGLPKIHLHNGDPAQGFAIFHEGRMVVFYTYSCDIGDGLEDPTVHPEDTPAVREQAARMAVNIAVYVLTH
jgi:hypothetical protein